jgi:hypothetical protein
MQASDVAGLRARGAEAHRAGLSFHDNPMYRSIAGSSTMREYFDWHDGCVAWASGWIDADKGQDQPLQALMRLAYW